MLLLPYWYNNPAKGTFTLNDAITYLEITSLEDGLLLPWLDLYETAFPPNEKLLVSHFLDLLKMKANGQGENEWMLAAVDSSRSLLGLACYERMPEVGAAVLWYLAVDPRARNRGLGGQFYDYIVGLADRAHCRALLLEVEIPERGESAEHSELARRRIAFYRRHGAFVLQGVDYLQYVGWHQPPTPMSIMVHPLPAMGGVDATACFQLAKAYAGDALTQSGSLALA
jgi:GNAT superfamily N-acetyltransferase